MQRSPSITDQRLGVMAKYWEPGRVKTRLAESWLRSPKLLSRWTNNQSGSASVTHENAFVLASELHRFFVLFLLERLQDCGARRDLLGTPADRLSALAAVANSGWRVVDQGEGDLGERMSRWFLRGSAVTVAPGKRLAESPPPHVQSVMIGSDCPLLDPVEIAHAFQRLENDDLVLGPASDGGYYLIGMSSRANAEQVRRIFNGIAWSTSDVLAGTLRAADQNGWQVALLDTQDDVDSVEDLDRLLGRAKAASEHSVFFDELIEVIESGLEMSR